MSRRKTRPGEIQDPERYFHRMIALERKREREADQEYQDRFPSLEAILEGGDAGPRRGSSTLLITNEDGREYDRYITESDFLGWIEAIENQTLFEAVKSLSPEDQTLLTYRFRECLTQAQTATAMGFSQTAVSYREQRIKKIIRLFFEKVAKKR